ncbi:translation initiation factor IF-2 N-terminal domain-containing protein [Nocardia concava]|uniref:translation initiation factor IF-2 N-terminal domain-containing protein n=1 Tax=Nocardia concava TaxID=257281 RepID=UPI0002DA65DE|nr:translation initiation factor IF-2 N-terminal domain-containing protein [Nocardia concava]
MEPTRQQRRAAERERAATKTKLEKQIAPMVGGEVDGKPFNKWPAWEGLGVPTRETCDLSNPRQAFLWMFVAMPAMKGAPLMLPIEYFELQSFRMWTLGARPAAEPTLKYQAPASVTANQWQAAGKWVSLDTPDPVRKTIAEVMRELPQHERAEIRAAVLEGFGLADGEKPGPPAMRHTVASLAKRLKRPVPELIEVLGSLGVTNVHADSPVGREVAERIVAHMGLE